MIPLPNAATLPDEPMDAPEIDDTTHCRICGMNLIWHTPEQLESIHSLLHEMEEKKVNVAHLLGDLRAGISAMHNSGRLDPMFQQLTTGMLNRLAEEGIR